MKRGIAALCTILGVLSVALPTSAEDAPWVSAPSAVNEGDEATVTAGNLPPDSVVTVTIKDPLGTESSEQVEVGADGQLAVQFTILQAGIWTAEISDASGQPVGSAHLSAGTR